MIGPSVVAVMKLDLQDWQLVLSTPLQERHSLAQGWQTRLAFDDRGELAELSKKSGGQELLAGMHES